LPLVGAILGAIIGGVVGAYANSRARVRETKETEDRERKGLLLLISAEVYDNDITFRTQTRPSNVATGLTTNVWDNSQVRLANLLTTRKLQRYQFTTRLYI
jgi:hypothetical protein